ncbi:helix-turn-helix domain-containing protein [Paenibacillus paeoniae]|uniref:Helix-turn-helix domain-containing protein n=1 Tax=Paenibacillus paeoniae TaxID=2292705 RepID=A0A371PKN0_9BACL|nr:helix-turn-helix domain-containing protein [Paenibacillus paeoniae]REK76764.1 helix-turn-helix domain-containing protein [Paenibacillus paeoniae]
MNAFPIPFRSCLFHLIDVQKNHMEAGERRVSSYAQHYIMIGIAEGDGIWRIDGRPVRLMKGAGYLIAPGSVYEVEDSGAAPLGYYQLECSIELAASFTAEQPDTSDTSDKGILHTLCGRLQVQPVQWISMLEQLYLHQPSASMEGADLQAFRQHIRLQELLYYLCEQNSWETAVDPRRLVDQTIAELHTDNGKKYSIQELAGRANTGVRQYNNLFKELTGRSPLEYMTELHMNQAKKQLLISNVPLSSIARSAGFQDVYYFSRRFKQMVGLSPKQYIRQRRSELRVVAFYYGGILLSMGVKPVGANLTWWGGSAFLKEMESDITDVGVTPSLDMIAGLEPDLILMNSNNLADYEPLSKIAPAVMIPYDGNRTVYDDMRIVGELIGSTPNVNRYIARFESKAAAARAMLHAAKVADERTVASIIRFDAKGEKFAVFGSNYGRSGWSLYSGLHLLPPRPVRSMMEHGIHFEQHIPIDRLSEYAAESDYIFVIHETEGTEHVAGCEIWEQLRAVRHGRVFELGYERYSYFDPISIESQLDLLTALLLGQSELAMVRSFCTL